MRRRQQARPSLARSFPVVAVLLVVALFGGNAHATHLPPIPPDRFDIDCTPLSLTGATDHDVAATHLDGSTDLTGDGIPDLVVAVPRASFGNTLLGAVYVVASPLGQAPRLDASHAVLKGPSSGSQAGRSIAPAGDLNGDGIPDLVIGAPVARSPGSGPTGAAFVFFGPIAAGTRSMWDADVTILGGSNHGLGADVAGVGDVNGDGFDDLLVGAPGVGTTDNRHGAAYLFHGPLAGTYQWHEADVTLTGSERDGQAGRILEAVGDVDGDGRADLAIAAPYARSYRGVLHIVRASQPAGPTFTLDGSAATWTGEAAGDTAGMVLERLAHGAHGGATLLIGAPAATIDGIQQRGAAYVIDGGTIGSQPLADATARYTGPPKASGFGTSAADIGDLDGDGMRDLAIGAPSHASGTVHVYGDHGTRTGSVPVAAANLTFHGREAWDGLGLSVTGADLDQDGRPDLVVGIPGEDGPGTARGAVRFVDRDLMTTDTDSDVLLDACELHRYGTNPNDLDTDNDHLYDGEEVLVFDSDPRDKDTDGDLASDLSEAMRHTDPRNPFEFPVLGVPVRIPVPPPYEEMPVTDEMSPLH